jgi:tetraacyldisaccharide 4'-kinase
VKSVIATYWRALASGQRNDLLSRLLRMVLVPASLVYALLQRLRADLYRSGALNARRLPRPVISVGNITVGGTGKTPVTAYIARQLLAQGVRVAVLSRGYGGSREGETAIVSDGVNILLSASECGDEPFLLARGIPGLMVIIGPDRFDAGLLALERLKPDIFLLDDGFQHLRLHRDLNLLLLDYTRPFGNGWTLPAGLLREPIRAANRADLVIRTRCPERAAAGVVLPGIPQCNARHLLGDAVPLDGGDAVQLDAMRGKKILAFAGIAEPGLFFDELRGRGLDLAATIDFPDHVAYGTAAVQRLTDKCAASGAEIILTTEKDGVKLMDMPAELRKITFLVQLELVMDDPAPLISLLRNLLQK